MTLFCEPADIGFRAEFVEGLRKRIALHDDPEMTLALIEDIRQELHALSPVASQPVDRIRWVPVDMVEPNDYNPNSVAKVELGLLYTSILHDGYTQPVVTIWDAEKEKYVIVDGFHRYFTCRNNQDIRDRNLGYLPVVVLDKPINDRMASTVRHNRARGKHSIDGMSNMVFQMLENGWSEAEICAELGMEAEEVLRLKHITGFSKLFEDVEYKKAWESKVQLKLRKQAEKQAAADSAD
jgi:ParB-like chromosome segregation protein Spo0J